MQWKLDNNRSIWPQLKEHMMRAIVSGEYSQGEPFPTVRQLAQEAGVNRNTMQRAMAELENDGLLITYRTAGRTVTTDCELIATTKEKLAEQNIANYMREMTAIGYSEEDAIEVMIRKGKSVK